MVTCQVESTSSRNASNSSSARSTSSTRRTAGDSRSARRTGRASRKRSSNSWSSTAATSCPVARHGLDGAQVQDLAREVPVVEGLGRVDALVALEPDQRQVQRLGDAPRRARSCRCRARPRAAGVAAVAGRARQPSRGRRRRGSPCRRAPAPVPPPTRRPRVAPCPQHHSCGSVIEGARFSDTSVERLLVQRLRRSFSGREERGGRPECPRRGRRRGDRLRP